MHACVYIYREKMINHMGQNINMMNMYKGYVGFPCAVLGTVLCLKL